MQHESIRRSDLSQEEFITGKDRTGKAAGAFAAGGGFIIETRQVPISRCQRAAQPSDATAG
jgi:hypothetical protein